MRRRQSTRLAAELRRRLMRTAVVRCAFPGKDPLRPISAADAVSPAIERTRDFLFRPFSWGTYLKLGLVAIVTEGVGRNFNSSSHHGPSPGQGPSIHSPLDIPPQWIAAIVAAVLVALAVSFVVFYLVTRLRFAFFHCLVSNTRLIRPGWWLYGSQAMRFFWLNVVVGFCFLLAALLAVAPFAGRDLAALSAIPLMAAIPISVCCSLSSCL